MIIYQSSKKEFVDNVLNPYDRNRGIADIIKIEFEKRIGKVHDAEYHAWQNSLRHMATVVDTPAIPDDATVCVEYRLPYQNSRIDFIIAGKDGSGNENVVIVELKQWSSVTALADADLVRTVINGGERNVPHPSYQAWSYAITLQEYNECVQNDGVLLYPCAFLHNYAPMHDDPILDKAIFREIDKAPVFTGYDALKLREFIAGRVSAPDDGNVMLRIDYDPPACTLPVGGAYERRCSRYFLAVAPIPGPLAVARTARIDHCPHAGCGAAHLGHGDDDAHLDAFGHAVPY